MAAFVTLSSLQGSLLGTQISKHKTIIEKKARSYSVQTRAKFDVLEVFGGRGLCNGEAGLEKELKRQVEEEEAPAGGTEKEKEKENGSVESTSVAEDGFEKEMMGLTGGFPGGEKGLKKFIEENPPPPKQSLSANKSDLPLSKKPKPPELPLLLPGMIAIVSNPNNPYYMYCGIVQRITDGKAGVLFEGGNWDRLITFRLDELQRREKGPPMKNPKSVVLEPFLNQKP